MKKLIAILLVVLVAGFVFGADPEPNTGDATLTLISTVEGRTTHGFHTGPVKTSFSSIFGSTLGNLGDGENSVEVEMEGDGALDYQGVGFYSFASNSKTGVDVSISATPMTLTVTTGEGENQSISKLFVPFNLVFAKGDDNGTVGTSKIYKIGDIDAVPVTEAPVLNLTSLVSDSSVGGVKWASYTVQVLFNGGLNEAYGLPEGDYSSTITASITAD